MFKYYLKYSEFFSFPFHYSLALPNEAHNLLRYLLFDLCAEILPIETETVKQKRIVLTLIVIEIEKLFLFKLGYHNFRVIGYF
jgi:hypothetical protein